MKIRRRLRTTAMLGAACLVALPVGAAVNIDNNASSIVFGTSFGGEPPLSQVLMDVGNSDYGGDVTFKLVNGVTPETESWYGTGAKNIIIEEIAKFASSNAFGWYQVGNPSNSAEIFSGAQGIGDTKEVSTSNHFGFYLDPKGDSTKRMFTEHLLNTGDYYQVAIYQVFLPLMGVQPSNAEAGYDGLVATNDFILGWEDLKLYSKWSDQDYQDMVVRATIVPVPLPAALPLFLAGLAGLGLIGRFRAPH